MIPPRFVHVMWLAQLNLRPGFLRRACPSDNRVPIRLTLRGLEFVLGRSA